MKIIDLMSSRTFCHGEKVVIGATRGEKMYEVDEVPEYLESKIIDLIREEIHRLDEEFKEL